MWLLEQPLVFLFAGAFAFAVSFAFWLQTRRPGALLAIGIVIGITTLGLIAERLVVTDAEEVEQTLRRVARDLERNDRAAVLQAISDSSTDLQAEVQSVLSRVRVSKVSVKRNLRVQVVERAGRKSAEARFNAVATVQDRGGLAGPQVVPRFVVVRFRLQGQDWKVVDYQATDPRDGLRGALW